MAASGAASFDTTLIGNSVWLDGSSDGFTKAASGFDAEDGKEFTLGTWFQLTEFGVTGALFCAGNGSGVYTSLRHSNDNKIYFQTEAGSHILKTTAVFRDVAWYHILVSVDTTQSTNTNRVKIFINGVEAELTGTYPALNHAYDFNLASVHEVGDSYENGAFEGYLAQSFMIGSKSIQQGDFAITDFLDSFTFGTNGSQNVPKKNSDIVTLTAAGSDNSFLLDYANSSDLGNDTSGYNNDFTATSMDSDNQTGSSPSSAFATWNPLRVNTQTQTFAEGNLRFSSTQTSTNPAATGNYGVSSGKWYWEVYVVAQGNTSNMLGICDVEAGLEDDTNALYASALMYSYEFAGTKRNNNSSTSYGDSIATDDIVGIALDMDNGGVYFSKNGTFQASGDPTSGSSLTNAAFTGLKTAGSGIFQPYYLAYSNGDGVANFGQSPTFNGQTTAGGNSDTNSIGNFKYSVPSGYSALTSANLTAPEYQGIDYFKSVLYTGNGTAIGSGGKAVTGVGFQPDWTWIKNRDADDSHGLYDIVRGVTKQLESDTDAAESTETEGLTTFGSDGFTVGNLDQVNTNTEDYVSWNWLLENSSGSANTDGSNANTGGNLTSTVAKADAGHLAIAKYTGVAGTTSTVGHGLGAEPDLVIIKNRSAGSSNFITFGNNVIGTPSGNSNGNYLLLNTNKGLGAGFGSNPTTITSTTVGLFVQSQAYHNYSGDDFIMWSFKSVTGVCKVGNYVGTGDATAGPYIDLGFKPAFFMTKSLGTEQWIILDNKRPAYNPTGEYLYANLSNAAGGLGDEYVDFLSSGVKIRTTGASANGNGVNFMYLAMADIGGNGTLPPVYGK